MKIDPLAKQIGKRISRFRRQKGITSERLAYENGLSKGYLSDLENGRRLPTLRMLSRLAKALEIPLKDFFE